MGKEDREGAGSAMKRSAGNAFGNTMGCFAAGIVILIILIAIAQQG